MRDPCRAGAPTEYKDPGPAYRFFFVRRLFFLVETGGTSEKADEVCSVGSIGAQAVALVRTFPSFRVVVVRMGMGILLGAFMRVVLRVTRTDTVLNDGENEGAEAPAVLQEASSGAAPRVVKF